jgi:uncharacterized protein (TIGR03437 family)
MVRKITLPLICLALGGVLNAQGIITTIAGTDPTYPGSSFSALSATFGRLYGVAVSSAGDVYFASQSRSIILKFSPQKNSVTIVAGIGTAGYSGDGGPAANAALNFPAQIAFDAAGNLYIADSNNQCIRKIDTQGVITTVGVWSGSPQGVGVAPDGTLYASNYAQIARLNSDGTFKVIAGTNQQGYGGDGGPASQALLANPLNLTFDKSGNLYFFDANNNRVRRITTAGTISTFAGNGLTGPPVSGTGALATPVTYPGALAFDNAGNLLISTGQYLVQLDPTGVVTVLNPNCCELYQPGPGPVKNAQFQISALAVDGAGNVYMTDLFAYSLNRLTTAGVVQTVAAYAPSFPIGDGGPAQFATLSLPSDLALTADGALLISDRANQRIRRISPAGTITTVAGTGTAGSTFPGPALEQKFRGPQFVASDPNGGFYVSEGCDVLHVTAKGDGIPIYPIVPGCPSGIAVDPKGNLYVADVVGNQVFMISPAGKSTLVAGNGQPAFGGDNGPATAASLNGPYGLALDANGALYVADRDSNKVRKIAPDGTITTIYTSTSSFQDGLQHVAVDRQGNVYVTSSYQNYAMRIPPVGAPVRIAGKKDFSTVTSGDGGLSTNANIVGPAGIAVDAAGNVYIAGMNENRVRKILAAPPTFSVGTQQVSLSAVPQGPQDRVDVPVTSSVQGLQYSISFATASGGDWLGVESLQGSSPGVLRIIADPSHLQSGTYTGTLTLLCPLAAPSSITIAVSLSVAPSQPAKLSLNTKSLSFSFGAGAGAASQQLSVANPSGTSVAFTASAATATGGNWLSVTQVNGTASAALPGSLTVTATPVGLAPGTYTGTVTVASAATGDNLTVPVTMAISASQQKILLSQTGLTFTAVAQGGIVLAQSFGILNAGTGSMSWTAAANTLSGGNWLSISVPNGTVARPLLDVAFVDVLVNASGLAAGNYFGTIVVNAPGAANSPQAITVVLNVLSPGSNPGPEVRPTGLVFTGLAGGANPGSQSVNLSNVAGTKQLAYGSSPTYVNGSGWLNYLPANATLDVATPARILVQPDFTQLAPGIYRGAITVALTDGSIRTVGILSVVASGAALSAAEGIRPLAASCSPNALQLQLTSSQQTITASIGQPAPIEMQVVDDCGTPLTPQRGGAAVAATFSNGDPSISMVHTANGRWSGTWQPKGAQGNTVRVTLTAFLALGNGKVLGGQVDLIVTLTGGAGGPVPLSVLNGASFAQTGILAPGTLISLFGTGLASAPSTGSGSPLPTDLSGTQVSLGGQALPLLYASDGQVNAQVPYGLSLNTDLQLQVKRGNSISVPQTFTVSAAQPAIFTIDQSGRGQGAIVDVNNVVVGAGNAASAGDTVVIYCTGLGPVSPGVAAGSPAPSQPLSQTVNPVTVTIGDQAAQVAFAGLTPGFSGLYQVNAVVPQGVTPGNTVPVVLSAVGQTGPAVTMAVK